MTQASSLEVRRSGMSGSMSNTRPRRMQRTIRPIAILSLVTVSVVGLNASLTGAAAAPSLPITFVNKGDIYKVSASGTDLTNLTRSRTPEDSPAWSTAHDQIAFGRGHHVWIMGADGSNPHQVLTLPSGIAVSGIAWSPNDQRIAVQGTKRVHVRRPYVRFCSSIWMSNSDGSSSGVVHSGEDYGAGITWSPSGKWLAMGFNGTLTGQASCKKDSVPGITKMRPNGGHFQSLHTPLGGDPDWSPSGRRIAFDSWKGVCHACSRIWEMAPNGKHQHVVLGRGFASGFILPRWSPSGAQIAYVSNGLRVMDRNGFHDHVVARARFTFFWPDW